MRLTRRDRLFVLAVQLAIVVVGFAVWQWGWGTRATFGNWVPRILNPYFIARPSLIWSRFLELGCFTDEQGNWLIGAGGGFLACLRENDQNLWIQTGATLRNTFWGFLIGSAAGASTGLLLGRSLFLTRIFRPFLVALNSLPRIAMVPLIILIFGLGDISKIVTSLLVVFFVVFFNTFEGARSVDRDQINASRLLGATRWQITRTVIIPSTMSWFFAALTPALSFSLIGVIVGEFIGAEHGLGRVIVEAEGRGDSTDMMLAMIVLMVVGICLAALVGRVQAYLLRWQPHLH
jgi:NitT/TauT family transport system permease protein